LLLFEKSRKNPNEEQARHDDDNEEFPVGQLAI
jgi:hypothetical protein